MGCSASTATATKTQNDPVPFNAASIFTNLPKRYGHPTQFKVDGYDVGIRTKDAVMGFYSIFLGTSKKNGDKVTIKEFHLSKNNDEFIAHEIAVLSVLSNSSIPKLHDIFVSNNSIYMVTDFIDVLRVKNYVDVRSKKTSLTIDDSRKIFKGLFSAVLHCHEKFILVRDLSFDNIMIKKIERKPSTRTMEESTKNIVEFEVKICDLSQSIFYNNQESSKSPIMEHPLFTWNQLPFLSPETVFKLPLGPASDIWSLGVLLYAMISGELPFYSEDIMDRAILIEKIKNADYHFDYNPIWDTVNDEIKKLIKSILVTNPIDRANAGEIRRNSWVLNGK